MGKHSTGKNPFGKRSLGDAAEHKKGLRRVPSRSAGASRRLGGEQPYQVSQSSSTRAAGLESAPARLKAERDRRRTRTKRIFAGVGIMLVLLLVVGAVAAFAWVNSLQSKMVVRKEKLDASLAKAEPQKPYTVLLLGGDRRKDEPYRTDTMILAKIDPQAKKVWMLSIPRDSRVEIPGYGAVKINSAFTYGGEEGAVEAVKKLTGVEINHYMQVDFRGFKKAVDALGGVWMDVPVAIYDSEAASHSKGKKAFVDAGYQLLDGDHALTFVRARHQFADQDFSRMKNQQLFFKALADQVAKSENLTKLPRVVTSVAPYIKTDMSLMEMVRTAQALRSAGGKNVYTETIPGTWRTPFIYLDEAKKEELLEKFNAGVSFDATEGAAAAAPAQAVAKAKKPAEITVTVRNGAGIAGCAKQASSILKARGFQVPQTGNASRFVYDKTLIIFKKDQPNAALVATALPPGAKLVESRGMYSFDTDVLVVIGKDWDLAKVPVAPVETE